MSIDLSQYVGKNVIVYLNRSYTPISGVVKTHDSRYYSEKYPYVISGWYFNREGRGYSLPQIKSIKLIDQPMTGIAQQHPNINLQDFEGQDVYFKWNTGFEGFGKVIFVGGVVENDRQMWCIKIKGGLSIEYYYADGIVSCTNSYIEEIYGEGAYELITKQTFDMPTESSDPAVEKAKEAIKDLTEEQIAKLLHSLKEKNND